MEVRASLQRNLDLNKPGAAHGQLTRLAACIDRGLECVKEEQQQIKKQVEQIRAVAETLKEEKGPRWQRKARFWKLQRAYKKQGEAFSAQMAKLMSSFAGGLFVRVRFKKGEKLPVDNDELERWFRKPKGHARRIHGRKHAGVRIVQEGPTLLLVLNAHEAHPQPFAAQDLLPYRHAQEPPDQLQAIQRRKVMRKARSPKKDNISSRSWKSGIRVSPSAFSDRLVSYRVVDSNRIGRATRRKPAGGGGEGTIRGGERHAPPLVVRPGTRRVPPRTGKD